MERYEWVLFIGMNIMFVIAIVFNVKKYLQYGTKTYITYIILIIIAMILHSRYCGFFEMLF